MVSKLWACFAALQFGGKRFGTIHGPVSQSSPRNWTWTLSLMWSKKPSWSSSTNSSHSLSAIRERPTPFSTFAWDFTVPPPFGPASRGPGDRRFDRVLGPARLLGGLLGPLAARPQLEAGDAD